MGTRLGLSKVEQRYRTSTKYWFSVSEFSGLVCEVIGAVGTGSIFSVAQYVVMLRCSVLVVTVCCVQSGETSTGIWSLAWSPTESVVAAGTSQPGVILYDLSSNRTILAALCHQDDVNAVTFADPSGNIIVTGSDDTRIFVHDRCVLRSYMSVIWVVASPSPPCPPLELYQSFRLLCISTLTSLTCLSAGHSETLFSDSCHQLSCFQLH